MHAAAHNAAQATARQECHGRAQRKQWCRRGLERATGAAVQNATSQHLPGATLAKLTQSEQTVPRPLNGRWRRRFCSSPGGAHSQRGGCGRGGRVVERTRPGHHRSRRGEYIANEKVAAAAAARCGTNDKARAAQELLGCAGRSAARAAWAGTTLACSSDTDACEVLVALARHPDT